MIVALTITTAIRMPSRHHNRYRNLNRNSIAISSALYKNTNIEMKPNRKSTMLILKTQMKFVLNRTESKSRDATRKKKKKTNEQM